MKNVGNLPRPRAPFPKIFTLLDSQTKRFFVGKRTDEIAAGIKPGRVLYGDRWVRSSPIHLPSREIPILLGGRFDTAFAYDDGSFGLIDFKTTDPKNAHVRLYSRQLHCYALAAEHPAPGSLQMAPVTQLGLLCVEPVEMMGVESDVAYRGTPHWIEVERDDEAFMEFLGGVVALLERPDPPEPAQDCAFCQYLTNGSLALLTSIYDSG
jgi:hypothetical protein